MKYSCIIKRKCSYVVNKFIIEISSWVFFNKKSIEKTAPKITIPNNVIIDSIPEVDEE